MHCWLGGGATRISQSSKAPATIESKVPKNIFNQMNKSNRTATITNWILAATPPLLTIVGFFAHSHGAKSRHRGMLPIITLSSKHTLIHCSFSWAILRLCFEHYRMPPCQQKYGKIAIFFRLRRDTSAPKRERRK